MEDNAQVQTVALPELRESEGVEADFGPHTCGAQLVINPAEPFYYRESSPLAVDVETDERDGFVGAAVCGDDGLVQYFTDIVELESVIRGNPLIGHNLKGDIHWLRKWGVNVDERQMFFDTMIASYVMNPTRLSHGLKPLSAEMLKLSWPSYSDMVGKGRKRITLDKQPMESVARYCGMDSLATWKLYCLFQRTMTPNQRRVFNGVEMPVNRILFKIENRGVMIDVKLLDELDRDLSTKIQDIMTCVREMTKPEIKRMIGAHTLEGLKEKWEQTAYKAFQKTEEFNPGSWQQKRFLLKWLGIVVESTDKKHLIQHKDNKLIALLLQHSEFSKLYNAFISAFKTLPTLPTVHTTYSQVSEDKKDEDDMHGIRTGRLSSKQPNLQQIPSRTDNGKLLRKLFVARGEEATLIVADYSQIELRLAAHFSHDPILVQAFKNGEDVHEATAKELGVDRFFGKTGNFLLAFGGSHYRLMSSLNIDEQKALDFYRLYWKKFRVLKVWKDKVIAVAKQTGGVRTILGRWIPVEDLDSPNMRVRGKAERRVVSCIIQGSAADVMKLAIMECDKAGYLPVLTVHDELVFEVSKGGGDSATDVGYHLDVEQIKEIMEGVVKLDVPLIAEVGTGQNWGDAKK